MKKGKIKDIFDSNFKRQRFFITIFIAILLTSMSVGYALYYEELHASAVVVLEAPLEIRIYDAIVGSSTSATDKGSVMTFQETNDGMKLVVDTTVHFDATGWGDSRATISYTYSVVNLSHKAYSYNNITYSSEITNGTANIGDPVISGLTKGQVLQPGEELTFTASLTMGAILGISYEKDAIIHIELDFKEGESSVNIGTIESTLSSKSVVVDEDKHIGNVKVSLLNIYGSDVEYTLQSTNTDVTLVDKSGNSYTYTGQLGDGKYIDQIVYLKVADSVDLTDGVETSLKCNITNGSSFDIGTVLLSLDPEPKWNDATVSYNIVKNVLKDDEYTITFRVNNNGDRSMDQFTAYLYLDSDLVFTNIDNSEASISYLPDKHLIKLSSNVRGTDEHTSIASGDSLEFKPITVNMNQTDLIIKDSVIFRSGEQLTDNFNYTTVE